MPYPLPLTRTEAYLAYKAGVIQQSDLKPSLAVPRIGIDDWLAYWTGLKNDYPKNPDGTPKMLQEEEKYIAYLCGVTDTYPEKCLRRVGAYLRYLISARWGRPDHPLNREELYLSLLKTQVIPSGDPSSDIVIDGTAKAPFVDVKMYGDTFQQTYEGKNLAKPLSGGSKNGIAVSYDATEDVFVVDGTCTSNNTTIDILGGVTFESGTDYTLTAIPISGSVDAYHANTSVQLFTSEYGPNNVVIRPFTGESIQSSTANFGSNVTLVRNAIRAENGDKFTNFKFRVQIEKNSTYSSYEPYVGGTASPNPDYPQPIQTVTGRQVVSVTGKNLFDIGSSINDYFASDADGERIYTNPNDMSFVEANFAGSSFTVTSYNTAGWRWMSKWVELSKNTDYRISTSKATGAIKVVGFNSKEAGTGGTVLSTLSGEQTFNSGDYEFYAVSIYPHSAGATFSNIQIELGSTATQFVPYSKHTYPLDLGSLELCRIEGKEQPLVFDYIYKDGDSWKVHKALGKQTIVGSDIQLNSSYSNVQFATVPKPSDSRLYGNYTAIFIYNDHAIYRYNSGGWNNSDLDHGVFTTPNQERYWFGYPKGTSLETMQSELNGAITYYALATPTDTTITDQTLIAQLDSLVNGGAEDGTTYIKVNATDPNLPGLLYVEAPKYE